MDSGYRDDIFSQIWIVDVEGVKVKVYHQKKNMWSLVHSGLGNADGKL
jgi:hypothetical protein